MKKLILAFLVCLSFGCENTFNPEYTLAWSPPVVSSLVITSSSGPVSEIIPINTRLWRYSGSITAIDFSEIKDLYLSSNPVLNSSETGKVRPETRIVFNLPTSGNVRFSLLPARFPFESPELVRKRFFGMESFRLKDGVKVLFEGLTSAGSHSIAFDARSMKIPSGVYILSLEYNNESMTTPIYIVNSCDEAITELRPFVFDCLNEN